MCKDIDTFSHSFEHNAAQRVPHHIVAPIPKHIWIHLQHKCIQINIIADFAFWTNPNLTLLMDVW